MLDIRAKASRLTGTIIGGPRFTVMKDSARKLIAFDLQTASALKLLASDRMMTMQELADEAFADLLKKHHRPTSLKDALKQSLRAKPAKESARRH